MSASLVGSEMCIRDRFFECPPEKWASRGRLRLRVGCRQVGHGWHLAAHAVSYTHLTLPTICSV
eukprot:14672865-Alexandrium_andersonii.AAC.1